MVRILHVLGSLSFGGTETMIMNYYRRIDKNKIQFDFVVHSNAREKVGYYNEIIKLGGKVYFCPRYNLKNQFKYKKWWNKFFNASDEYKIIHGHVRSTASIYLNIAKKHNLYTIAHSHSTSSGKGISAIIKNIFQYKIRFIADYFFACSRVAGEWLFGKKIVNSNKFTVLKNAINVSNYIFSPEVRCEMRKKFDFSDDEFVIGFVGGLRKPKNIFFLLDIYKFISAKKNNCSLVIVGDGPLKDELIQYSNKISKNIYFCGEQSNVNDYLQMFDCFIFPSFWEGLGIAAIESQTCDLMTYCSNGIPVEANLIKDRFKTISLTLKADKWADIILNDNTHYTRIDRSCDIINAGYDIGYNVLYLEEFYIKVIGDINE